MSSGKELFIVRHAKSSWENSDEINDIDRPLSTRGVHDAYALAKFLTKKDIYFDRILSSNGIRALHTAVIMAKNMGLPQRKIKIKNSLYHPLKEDILRNVKRMNNKYAKIAVFSHNPGIADFVFECHPEIYNVPTCSVIRFQANIDDWQQINYNKLELLDFFTPKTIDK